MAVSTQTTSRTSVLVVSKDQAVLSALTRLLALDEQISVVGSASTINSSSVSQASPDVIVLDGPQSADEAAKARMYLSRMSPGSKLFPLAMLGDMTLRELLEAIKEASNPAPAPNALEAMSRPAARGVLAALSGRELEVVRLLAEGLSNKEISSRLSLSDKTVKNHISHILAKTGLTARTQVAVYAIRAGLV